jgi:phospholipase C
MRALASWFAARRVASKVETDRIRYMARRDRGSGEGFEKPTPDRIHTRRSFLTATGVAAASGLAVGGAAGAVIEGAVRNQDAAIDPGFTPIQPRSAPGFDHIVVLMYENRSFDNILGRLYTDSELAPGQKFDGLNQGRFTNEAFDGTVVEAHPYQGSTDTIMSAPDPDPGETYPHVNTQLFGTIDPPSNQDIFHHGISAPFNAPVDDTNPTMTGFVKDYIINFANESGGEVPDAAHYRQAMGGFTPEMLPVISALARNFATYDHWYAAVPSQTFCNRSFFHAGTSHGYVTNMEGGGYNKWLEAYEGTTIFNRLEEAGKTWRVYYDADQLVSLTGLLHAPHIEKYWKSNFRGMEQFHQDAADGSLPDYAFIEPRMVFNHNDMHPPHRVPETGAAGNRFFESALSDARAAEVLIAEVYRSIKNSASSQGSNAMNTAFVMTFDEHGGIYDHVPPPRATPPSGKPDAGEMGFTFDRLGCRVPTIVISAYTRAGTVINEEMHHGSIVHTICQQHNLKPLTHRDDTATGIFNAVNLTKPRQPALWPDVYPSYVPANPESLPPSLANRDLKRPLTPPGIGLLGMLLSKYEPDAPIPQDYADAYAALQKHGTGLFGDRDEPTTKKKKK